MYSKAFGVKRHSKTFAIMFFLLMRNIEAGKWASANDELRLDGHEITANTLFHFNFLTSVNLLVTEYSEAKLAN